MNDSRITIELPIKFVEPLFSALHAIRPNTCSRIENKAVSVLRESIYLELELYMETLHERTEREINFQEIFQKERKKKEKLRERAFVND